ncbi:transcription/translation regulatory transformer protein RfaH [Pusillimonas sp. NJUB218]|uniref:transcription/translation regulatory transformer protein RfaH n=1 Tax=Pusillimonas sp. NJUB218 TaxID=2023230 RepID=UPI000F4B0BC6|nr:transcription/translation regulatory transformer protein RfaH [Pusillimonas sp. NJUB218]ROT46373.1 transcription/translation regulatory transformer protein RfaH [Pusillimonas sp. NJUB218]
MQWYLIHTKPRQEDCALQNLERQGYTCYLPLITTERLKSGRLIICQEPLFHRYLFIQLGNSHNAQSWTPIRSTRGVSRLVMFGSDPQKIDSPLIEKLRQQEASAHCNPERFLSTGERVLITGGAFSGIEGIYQMNDGEQRAMVLIELISKPVTLKISPKLLRSAN